MNILHVSHHFHPCKGGIESVVLQSCKALLEKGHECEVVCLNKCAKSKAVLPAESIEKGVSVKRIPFIDLGVYKIAASVLGIVKESGADVVHVHGINFFSDFLLFSKPLHGKKVVVSTHGGVFHTKKLGALKKAYFGFCQRLLLNRANKVIAVSESDLKLFGKIVPREKLVLVENPVDVPALSSTNGNVKKNSFLFVGRLSRNKGLEKLLEAFAIVASEKKDAMLYIVGGDFEGLKAGLEAKAEELGLHGKVEITGEVSEKKLLEHYQSAELFASASEYEGFGITAVEAMAAGKIVLLNSIPSFRKFVKHGVNGFVLDFSNPEKAGKAMLNAANLGTTEKGKIVQAARNKAKDFSLQKYGEKLERIYMDVVG